MLTDAQLIEIEIATLWKRDARGRLTRDAERHGRPAPHFVIAVANDGQRVAIGSDVPDALAVQLRAAIDESSHSSDSSTPPAALAKCRQLLEPVAGSLELSSGPSYWIPLATRYASEAVIVRSDGRGIEPLRRLPPDGWRPDEWRDLIDGALGPWAAAVEGDQVVALCHSARLTDRGAEAGVWTAPGHRGKGLAAAVTAAWSALFDRDERHLFYSTSADNASSQNVALRLNLRPIGWMWKLSSPANAASS
jgi:hypothetical protein